MADYLTKNGVSFPWAGVRRLDAGKGKLTPLLRHYRKLHPGDRHHQTTGHGLSVFQAGLWPTRGQRNVDRICRESFVEHPWLDRKNPILGENNQ